MEKLVSIILPVYNVEGYLPRCVESILLQSYSCFEIILVDDGSTDGSGALTDAYSRKDSRIRTVHQSNKGPSAARNLGLSMAAGDYLCFIDSDDFIHPDYLKTLVGNLEKGAGDVSYVHHSTVEADAVPQYREFLPTPFRTMKPVEAIEEILYQRNPSPGIPHVTCSAWGCLCRRETWGDLRFQEGILYEDLDIFYRLLFNSKKVVASPLPLYYYCLREGSILHTFGKERQVVLDNTRRISAFMEANHPELAPAAHDRELSANFNMLMLMHRHGAMDTDTATRCWQTIRKYRRESLLNPRVRLKNKLGILASYIFGKGLFRWIRPR